MYFLKVGGSTTEGAERKFKQWKNKPYGLFQKNIEFIHIYCMSSRYIELIMEFLLTPEKYT